MFYKAELYTMKEIYCLKAIYTLANLKKKMHESTSQKHIASCFSSEKGLLLAIAIKDLFPLACSAYFTINMTKKYSK